MKYTCWLIFSLLLIAGSGCGGGDSGDNSDILENGLLGRKTGSVFLSNNGCAQYRDIPVGEISFSHNISAAVVGDDKLDITFTDNGYVCNALGFDRLGGSFDGNCGTQPLIDFLPGYSCTQELVWFYSEPTSGIKNSTADVLRIAYVRCSQGDLIQFACPVEYRGSGFDCLNGVC